MCDNRVPLPPFEAVSLDVGGVLILPDQRMVSRAARADVLHDPDRFFDGHYRAMAEIDRLRPRPEEFGDYMRGFLRAVGTPDVQLDAGAAALATVLGLSSVWRQRIPGAVAAARRLAAAGLRLAVTSNSDGTVAERMRHHGVMQVGEGPGVPVEHITDSGVLGVAKPHPAMFLATAEGLALPPERICHVGDSGCYDADGATAVGMVAVHVDPLSLCRVDHHHVESLVDFAHRALAAGNDLG